VIVLLLTFSLSWYVQVAKAQSELCPICEFVVNYVEKYLADNSTDQEILQKLADACSLLTDPSWVTKCKTFIDTDGEKLIQYIVNKESPEVVCAAVDLCNASSVAIAVPKPKSSNKASVSSDLLCGVCAYIVKAVEGYVQANATQQEILGLLEKDCTVLKDKNWISTCQGTIATFGPEIIGLVVQKQPPDVVCTEIGMCNSSKRAQDKMPQVPVPIFRIPMSPNATLVCLTCEVLVNFTEVLIANNKTETEIIQGLNDVCKFIPDKSWSADCTKMVEEYGSIIVNYLVNEEPPGVVCTELKLCKSSAKQQCPASKAQC